MAPSSIQSRVLILFIFFPYLVYSQSKTIILHAPDAGTKNYTARDAIYFNAGYSYSTSEGNSMNATVAPGLQCNTDYISVGSLPNLTDRTLDKLLQVGTTNGAFNVSATGGATYQIPIYAPPGTNGVQPQISIVYNSQGGNGLLGMGWNISGLSAITRVPKNHYFNSEAGGITLTNSDQLSLDGNRLLYKSGTYGAVGATYYTEVETFSTISSLSSPVTGKQYIKVEAKDGTLFEYGNTEASYVDAVGTSIAIMYRLNKVTDVFGNSINYNYAEINGESYITGILYTGNSTLIEFNYELKGDPKTYYLAGKAIPETVLLYKISVLSTGTKLREYNFKYAKDIYTHLVQVDEINSENKKFNSTLIQWDEINKIIESNILGSLPSNKLVPPDNWNVNFKDRSWVSGDFNNDGFDDLISIFKFQKPSGLWEKVVQLYKVSPSNNNIPSFTLENEFEVPSLADYTFDEDFNGYSSNSAIKNLDGDKIPEIVFAGYDHTSICKISFYCLHYDGSDTGYLEKELLSTTTKMPAYAIEDLNADGLDDIVYVENSKIGGSYQGRIGYFGLNGNVLWVNFDIPNLTHAPEKIFISDFNSDGLKDIMLINVDGFNIYTNSNGNFSTVAWYSNNGFNSTYSYIKPGDFNGDGMIDFLLNGHCNSVWKLFINRGWFDQNNTLFIDNPISNITAREEEYTDYNNDEDDCIVTDFNNDGKSDIIIIDAVYDNGGNYGIFRRCEINWYTWDGVQFNQAKDPLISPTVNYSLNTFNTLGDFNGDGRVDLLNYGSELYTNVSMDSQWRIYNSFNNTFGEGIVTAISNGLNYKSSIAYRPINYTTTPLSKFYYTKGTTSLYPISDIQGPLYCTWKITNPDGNGDLLTTEYSYENARIHSKGRGFLGFEKITFENIFGRTISKNELSTTFYVPFLAQTLIQSPSLNTISKTDYYSSSYPTYTNPIHDLGNKRYYFYYAQTVKYDVDGNLIISDTDIDSIGNLTFKGLKTSNGSTVISDNYTLFSGHNSKGQPASALTMYSRPIDGLGAESESTTYTYNSNGTMSTSLSKGITTTYDYTGSVFGLPKSIKISATGMPDKLTQLFYDSKGRFQVKAINPMNHISEVIFNDFGNPVLQKDPNDLTIENTYDGWGNLITSKGPDGNNKIQYIKWANGGDAPLDGYYFTETIFDGNPVGAVYFDALGRVSREVSIGPDGSKFYKDTKYNTKGQITEVSEPYPYNGSISQKTLYTYKDDGRLDIITLPNLVSISYTYEGNKITTTNSTGEIYYKIIDASGLLVESKDPGGIIKYFYERDGKTKRIEAPGGQTVITYNTNRLQETLTDPDAGVTTYGYNGIHQLSSQIDANTNSTSFTYDLLGRVKTRTEGSKVYTYIYDGIGAIGNLMGISEPGGSFENYTYDELLRLKEETRGKGTNLFTYKYEYDLKGNISKISYPAGMVLNYNYNTYNDLTSIYNGTTLVWRRDAINPYGQIYKATYGNNKQITYDYDTEKRMKGKSVPNVIDYDYEYNNKQQLNFREEKYYLGSVWNGFREDFEYDGVNRLKRVTKGGIETLNMTYQSGVNDRIEGKSDAGWYSYQSNSNHRLENFNQDLGSPPHDITYTGFGKVSTINETGSINKLLTLTYGVDNQRFSAVYKENGGTKYTRYYFKNYEKEITSAGTRHLNYIYAAGSLVCIYEQKTAKNTKHYIYTDHLGSIRCITDSIGNVTQVLSYDAWGNRRDPITGIKYSSVPAGLMFYRGYTGHEHLDELGLINMNGRVYDPAIALFLSPDNYVQNATNSQNFNRYTYCLNNPLMYTDPSGDFIAEALAILAFAYTGGVQANFNQAVATGGNPFNPGEWNWNSGNTYYGILSGGSMGASIAGIMLPSLFPTQPSVLLEGLNEAGRQVLINGSVNIIDGDPFFEDWYWAAGKGFIKGGFKGYQLANEIGLKGNDVIYCSQDKRAQAWMDYYWMKNDIDVKWANKDELEILNSRFGSKYKYEYDGTGSILRYNKLTGEYYENIVGISPTGTNDVYLTRKIIRNARLNGGWGKGTFYHEGSHALWGYDEQRAYELGLRYGGWRYKLRTLDYWF